MTRRVHGMIIKRSIIPSIIKAPIRVPGQSVKFAGGQTSLLLLSELIFFYLIGYGASLLSFFYKLYAVRIMVCRLLVNCVLSSSPLSLACLSLVSRSSIFARTLSFQNYNCNTVHGCASRYWTTFIIDIEWHWTSRTPAFLIEDAPPPRIFSFLFQRIGIVVRNAGCRFVCVRTFLTEKRFGHQKHHENTAITTGQSNDFTFPFVNKLLFQQGRPKTSLSFIIEQPIREELHKVVQNRKSSLGLSTVAGKAILGHVLCSSSSSGRWCQRTTGRS